MGLSGSETDPFKPTFTQDVFRLEICGPEEDNLSIIDVPGIFKNTASGLTTKLDMEMVKKMVLGYMRKPRSRKCGHSHTRSSRWRRNKGAENKVIDLVEGKSHSLPLGWIVVRNAAQQQLLDQSSDRDLVEARFFRENHPWSNLPKDKVGIHALKIRLQEVQTTQIRREFPKMRTDVGRKPKAMRHDLSAFGNERNIVSQAMTTSYGTHELFDKEKDTRLTTIIRNRMEGLKSEMEEYGLEYQFVSEISDIQDEEDEEDGGEITVRKHMGVLDNSGAIDGILHEQEIVEKPTTDSILAWIEDQYCTSRGFEVGTFPPSLLCTIMNRQSGKRADLALGYVRDVIEIMHAFILKVLGVTCPDEQICDKLVSVLADELSKRYREAMEQAKLVLDVERMNITTLNDGFYESLEETQKRSHREKYEPTDDEAKAPMSNTESTVRYIHDILAAYYDVASKRFVDNICTQSHRLLSVHPTTQAAWTFLASVCCEPDGGSVDGDCGGECGAEPATCTAEDGDSGLGNWSKDYDVDLICMSGHSR
ncbi:hypothetical protein DTO012A7_1913 [Penicillium roqueforti]|nr:hypothetical protein CBS147311_3715 [Penicillium roqueforti]KAI3243096.1 hypothetical protein DTO012A7_1913 [Penicillium roqueforti]